MSRRKQRHNKKLNSRDNFIYFLTDGTYTKIGKTRSPRSRISTIQVGSPKKLEYVYMFRLSPKYELKFHREFSSYKTNSQNEWFEFESEQWLHNRLTQLQRNGWEIDVYQASHLAGLIIRSRTRDVKKNNENILKKQTKKSKTKASLIIEDVKQMLLKENNVIYYNGLVKKYNVDKKVISYYIKSAKLSKQVWLHNKRLSDKKFD